MPLRLTKVPSDVGIRLIFLDSNAAVWSYDSYSYSELPSLAKPTNHSLSQGLKPSPLPAFQSMMWRTAMTALSHWKKGFIVAPCSLLRLSDLCLWASETKSSPDKALAKDSGQMHNATLSWRFGAFCTRDSTVMAHIGPGVHRTFS